MRQQFHPEDGFHHDGSHSGHLVCRSKAGRNHEESHTRLLKTIAVATVLAAVTLGTVSPSLAQCGGASWYGPGFHGKKAASGERFNQNAMTAAHRSLPFGTEVQVTDQRTGKAVTVTINDRG